MFNYNRKHKPHDTNKIFFHGRVQLPKQSHTKIFVTKKKLTIFQNIFLISRFNKDFKRFKNVSLEFQIQFNEICFNYAEHQTKAQRTKRPTQSANLSVMQQI